RERPDGALAHQRLDRATRTVVHHALVPTPHEAAHHVCTHASETDHADLHWNLLDCLVLPGMDASLVPIDAVSAVSCWFAPSHPPGRAITTPIVLAGRAAH